MNASGAGRPEAAGRVSSPLFWRQLFSGLREGRVIPVVGQDAVVVEGETGRLPLNEYIARRVEALLDLPRSEAAGRLTLHEVACRYVERAGAQQISDVYWAVNEAMAERPIDPPEALRKLAGIEAFTLYVTTTFDDLLQKAINQERFGGAARTQTFAYSPGRVEDLPAPIARLGTPAVYHLLGRLSVAPEYVVTEEDTLEFVHSLQSANRQPALLLDELRSHSLLLIGSGYSGWLMRFFLRITKPDRLLLARKRDIVVDARARDDASLATFLRYFSAPTQIFTGDPIQFIDELTERWEEYRGPGDESGPAPAVRPAPRVQENAIFVSYASEDFEVARRLAEAIRGAGLPVWFDEQGGLEGGDDFRMKILARIREASLFVPVLSRSVLTPQRRFFRLEWKEALDVEALVPEGQPFIVPVRVDDLPVDAPTVPERFRKLKMVDAPAGGDLAHVVYRLRELYREYQRALAEAS